MAPEQARGAAADRRADIWAFGVVVFEMLTGRRLFDGATVSDTLASVLKTEPDWTLLPVDTPASIRRLLRRCLEKDRSRRLDSAAGSRLEIDDALTAPAVDSLPLAPSHRTRTLTMGLALVGSGALVAALILWGLTPGAPAADPASRLSVNLEPGVHLGEAARDALYQQRPGLTAFALSPNARQLVYVGHDGKTSQLYVRHLDRDRAVAIAGTTGAQSPFFSPDGRDVGFFIAPETRDADGAVIGPSVNANGLIRRVAIAGGPVRTVEISGPAPVVFPSATWSADDTILLSGPEGIYRVPATGGTIERLIEAQRLRFPELLPGGRAILFNVVAQDTPSLADVAVETLDTHERTTLVRGGTFPRFVASGHVVFGRSGKLMAVPFDPATRITSGNPVVVGEDVMLSEGGSAYFRSNGTGQFAVSRSGSLAYVPGGTYAAPKSALTLIDRKGSATPLPLSPAIMFGATISPDGKQIAWAQGSSVSKKAIWLLDLERGVSRRLTEEGTYLTPVWSPDGSRLAAVARGDDGSPVLAVVNVDRGGAPQLRRLEASGDDVVYWAPTNHVFLQRIVPGAPGRLATLAMDGPSEVRPLFEWSTPIRYVAFSRDGKWTSYSVNETGAFEVYVRPVAGGTPITRVSVNGGTSSAWSADGRELFYREGSRMMAVPISTETDFRLLGPPRELFSGDYIDGQVPSRGFEVTSDGRFLMKTQPPATESAPVTSINLVLNWFEELKRLVPAK
jgi:eukaryotic-like serine/threonine-protein kinase